MDLTSRRQCQLILLVGIGTSFIGLAYNQFGVRGLFGMLLAVILFFPLMSTTHQLDTLRARGTAPSPLPRSWYLWSILQAVWLLSMVGLYGYLLFSQLGPWALAVLVGLFLAFDRLIRRDATRRAS